MRADSFAPLVEISNMRSRRSVADAFEVIRAHPNEYAPDVGAFNISVLPLPSGKETFLVSIHFKKYGETVAIVALPSCTHFRARREGVAEVEKFPIERLIDATVDPSGLVFSKDGTRLRSVEVIPTSLLGEPTELQWKIMHGVLAAFNYKHVYRSLRDEVQCAHTPDHHFLDCSRLFELRLPRLTEICYRLTRYDPEFAKISDQTIANALRAFGVRLPVSRAIA
jgi:hypothetical protein